MDADQLQPEPVDYQIIQPTIDDCELLDFASMVAFVDLRSLGLPPEFLQELQSSSYSGAALADKQWR